MSRRRVVDQEEPAACRHCGSDLVPVNEVGRRLELSAKTIKRLHRLHGLPLIRLANGRTFAFWSAVETWARERPAR